MGTTAEELKYSSMTRVCGEDESFAADVEQVAGKNRLATESTELIQNGISNASLTVGTTATPLRVGGSNQTNRQCLYVQNIGNSNLFVGDASVTASNGLVVTAGGTAIQAKLSDGVTLYGICAPGESTELRITEAW